jgi:hypothetical protein
MSQDPRRIASVSETRRMQNVDGITGALKTRFTLELEFWKECSMFRHAYSGSALVTELRGTGDSRGPSASHRGMLVTVVAESQRCGRRGGEM